MAACRSDLRLARPPHGERPSTAARAEPGGAAQATGLVAPQPAVLYATAAAAGHDFPAHPECAARVPAILEALEARGLTAAANPRVELVEGYQAASLEALLAVHEPAYLAGLERASAGVAGGGGATVLEQAPTYVTGTTYQDSLRAAGAAMALVDRVAAASALPGALAPSGFALCRPPGHHAVPRGAMGFCLLSNVAVAARYAQQRHGLKKVLIFDFDVHHGNGTNDIFFEDPSVLFISTHQAGSYPGTGKVTEVGKGDGEGYSINIPLPGDSGHEAILAAFDEVVSPAAVRFAPDIVLCSAGFDAHWRDPLAGLQLRSSSYHALASRLRALAERLCGGRLVLLLEGGYDLRGLSEGVANSFLGLLGGAADDKFNPALLRDEPLDKARAVLAEARRLHGL